MFFKKDKSKTEENKNVDINLSKNEFSILKVDFEDMDFDLTVGEEFSVDYHGPEDCQPEVKEKDGEISLTQRIDDHHSGTVIKKGFMQVTIVRNGVIGKVTVTVPQNKKLAKLNLRVSSGDAHLNEVEVEECNLTAASGDLKLKQMWIDDLEVQLASEDIRLNEVRLNHGNASLASGDFRMKDSRIEKELAVRTTSGDNLVENVEVDNCELRTMSGDNSIFGNKTDHAQIGTESNGSVLKMSTMSGDNRVR